MINPVQEFYGNRLRLRVCGLCADHDQLLLVNHHLVQAGDLWVPPGGGLEFGESVTDGLKREFMEETGLLIETEEFLFASEFLAPPLHAIELFFRVKAVGGTLKTGCDPELSEPVIHEVKFVSWQELAAWNPASRHGIFQKVNEPRQIMNLKGYFKL